MSQRKERTAMGQNAIVIKGAREHNLKDIDLTIPRDQLVVLSLIHIWTPTCSTR